MWSIGESATSTARAFWGTVVRPLRTFTGLERDERAGLRGGLVLLLVSGVYTLILLVFVGRGYQGGGQELGRVRVGWNEDHVTRPGGCVPVTGGPSPGGTAPPG